MLRLFLRFEERNLSVQGRVPADTRLHRHNPRLIELLSFQLNCCNAANAYILSFTCIFVRTIEPSFAIIADEKCMSVVRHVNTGIQTDCKAGMT